GICHRKRGVLKTREIKGAADERGNCCRELPLTEQRVSCKAKRRDRDRLAADRLHRRRRKESRLGPSRQRRALRVFELLLHRTSIGKRLRTCSRPCQQGDHGACKDCGTAAV